MSMEQENPFANSPVEASEAPGLRTADLTSDEFSADKIRFRLRDIMLATAVFSGALAIFKLAGIFGAVLAFLTAVCFSVAMITWLAFGWPLRAFGGFFVGVFSIGMLCANVIGIFLIPLSLIGIILGGVGLLGFTPLVTGYAYFRRM